MLTLESGAPKLSIYLRGLVKSVIKGNKLWNKLGKRGNGRIKVGTIKIDVDDELNSGKNNLSSETTLV